MLLCIANSLVASREVDGTLLPRVLNCPWRLRNVILFFGKKKKSHIFMPICLSLKFMMLSVHIVDICIYNLAA